MMGLMVQSALQPWQSHKMLVKIIVYFFLQRFLHYLSLPKYRTLRLHIQNFLLSHWVCDHCHRNRTRQLHCCCYLYFLLKLLFKSKHSLYLQTTLHRRMATMGNIRNICNQMCTGQFWVWTNFSKCLEIETPRWQDSVSVNATHHRSDAVKSYNEQWNGSSVTI